MRVVISRLSHMEAESHDAAAAAQQRARAHAYVAHARTLFERRRAGSTLLMHQNFNQPSNLLLRAIVGELI